MTDAPAKPQSPAADRLLSYGKAIRQGTATPTNDIKSLRAAEIATYLSSVDANTEAKRLRAALDEAFESILADTPEEAKEWAHAALEALAARDVLESRLTAIGLFLEGKSGQERATYDSLISTIAQEESALKLRARTLVGLNEARRAERDKLDPSHRDSAWWYSEFADDDHLVALFSPQSTPEATREAATHLSDRERELIGLVEVPPRLPPEWSEE